MRIEWAKPFFNRQEQKAKDDPRPASNASSGQEESVPSTNRLEDELGGINPQGVGGGTNAIQNERSMPQVIREKQNRRLLEDRKRCQLLIDIHSDDEGPPSPSACMVYRVLTEQLGPSKDPSNGVKAICTPNPSNHWRWLVLFTSENLKTKFQDNNFYVKEKQDRLHIHFLLQEGVEEQILIVL